MRIGRVIGRVTLSRAYDTLAGARFLIVEVQDRHSLDKHVAQPLSAVSSGTSESVVVFDYLGAGDGELIAFAESREAAMPFYPEKLVPIDACNAAILDSASITHRI